MQLVEERAPVNKRVPERFIRYVRLLIDALLLQFPTLPGTRNAKVSGRTVLLNPLAFSHVLEK